MTPLAPAVAGIIIDHLKIAIFFYRGPRLVYTNPAAETLGARLRKVHGIEIAVMLQDHLRLVERDADDREAVVLLTSPAGEPFLVHMLPLDSDGISDPARGSLVTIRELGADREALSKQYELSGRESQVVELVLRGYSNADIAVALGVSLATIKKHLTRIFDKVGVDSRARLISRLV